MTGASLISEPFDALGAVHPDRFTPAVEDIPAVCPAPYVKLDEEFATELVAPALELRTCKKTQHKAIHAAAPLSPGDVVCPFSYRALLPSPNYLTVQVGEGRHILLAPRHMESINHSCAPNVFFNTSTFNLECLRPVAVGEELCFFYPSTEWDMDSPFECLCGAPRCLGNIKGAKFLSSEQRRHYRFNAHIAAKAEQLKADGQSSDGDSM